MQIKYSYVKEPKVKSKDTIKLGLFDLDEYDCRFLSVDVKTKEGSRIINSSVIIPIKTKADIDTLIKELKDLKAKF